MRKTQRVTWAQRNTGPKTKNHQCRSLLTITGTGAGSFAAFFVPWPHQRASNSNRHSVYPNGWTSTNPANPSQTVMSVSLRTIPRSGQSAY